MAYMDRLVKENSAPALFAERSTLRFGPERTVCPDCGASLKVRKTRVKTVASMCIGEFSTRETLLHCEDCKNDTVYGSPDLLRLAPERCRFGYDVLVFVGKALFLRHRSTREIVEELLARNISVSRSEVEYLGKKFIVYLALAHRECAPKIREAMHREGGYIFHLDGTCDRKWPVLMSGLDAISEIVLGNVKLPSEKAEEIIPFLRETKERFGTPLALVHDMGRGILRAVRKVFPGVPDFICHYHFLRDIGKDLFEKEYALIRKRLRKHGIAGKLQYHGRRLKADIDQNSRLIDAFVGSIKEQTLLGSCLESIPLVSAYSLIQWALAGKHEGQGYGFPFDRPHVVFADRLRALYAELEQIKDIYLRGNWRDNKPLFKLSCELKKVFLDKTLEHTLHQIHTKIKVFDELRDAMRIAPKPGTEGLNSGDINADMGRIEKGVRKFRERLTADPRHSTHEDYKDMIAQINKYWTKLFADPIVVETPRGKVSIQPQRTNNIMERLFRDLRRANRRKSGNNSMAKTLQAMLADTPLVRNLENPQYMRILLHGHPTLEDRFAELDIALVRKELRDAQRTPERIPGRIKNLIADPTFPHMVLNIFQKSA